MIELILVELLLLFAVIMALVIVLNPKEKVSNYKSSLDFSKQDEENKKANI